MFRTTAAFLSSVRSIDPMLPTTTPPMRTSIPGMTNAALLKIARTW